LDDGNPALKGALAGIAALIWAMCAGELSVSVLVHGPGGDTLAIPIFGLLHAGIAADVAALCLLLMLLCGGAMALAVVALGRKS
jgi:iron(III) transport system permease protein